MFAWFRRMLRPPTIEDPEQMRSARVLYPMLLGVLGLSLVLALLSQVPQIAPNPDPVLFTDLVLVVMTLVSLALVRFGLVRPAALIFSIALWGIATGTTLVFGGISKATVVTYAVVTVVSGYFGGMRSLLLFTLLTVLTSFGMAELEFRGLLPDPLAPINPFNSWVSLTASLSVLTLLLGLSLRSTNLALDDARKEEAAHRDSEQRFRNLLEESPDALFIHSRGRILYANPSFARLLGHNDPAEFVGTQALDWLQAGASEDARTKSRALLASEGSTRITTDRWMRADGSVVPVEVHLRPLRFDGEAAVLISARDTSERERLEEQLRQSQKMESVGRFAGGIAHDFNNMLTAISGHNGFLLKSLSRSSEQYEDALEIQRAVGRASGLVKQLLAFGRRQVMQPTLLDLNEVLRETDSMLARLIGENIEFRVDFESEPWRVKADPVQIEQVLMNLVVNAKDSMPHGGRLDIRIRNLVIDPNEGVRRDLVPGEYVSVSVTDTGIGMDEETKSRIFDPFFTTKGRLEGTGLGLATVYGILEQSGGAIRVDSAPGRGSCFTVLLPRCLEEGVEEPTSPVVRSASGGRETILVAEDDAAVRRLTVRFLRDAGYQVLEARNGMEALDRAEHFDDRIDLVVTDVVMPELGGAELVDQLRASHPESRVLFVSGYPDDALGLQGIVPSATAFLAKPFSANELGHKVRAVLDAA